MTFENEPEYIKAARKAMARSAQADRQQQSRLRPGQTRGNSKVKK